MKRKGFILLLILQVLLSGCWDYKDINKLSIVFGMAVSSAEEEVSVVLEVAERPDEKKEGVLSRVVTVTGENINDAVAKAAKQMEETLYFGNMAIALIGKGDCASSSGFLDWLKHHREVRETTLIAAAEDAEAVLKAQGIASFTLRGILESSGAGVELYRTGEQIPLFDTVSEETEDGEAVRPVLSGSVEICKEA